MKVISIFSLVALLIGSLTVPALALTETKIIHADTRGGDEFGRELLRIRRWVSVAKTCGTRVIPRNTVDSARLELRIT